MIEGFIYIKNREKNRNLKELDEYLKEYKDSLISLYGDNYKIKCKKELK